MKNLDKLRKKIDLIDDKILELLKNRSKIALDIGNLKSKNSKNSNLFRPERQMKILSRLFLNKNSLLSEQDILSFWKEIFFHQTNLQGGIEFLISETLKKSEKKIIFDAFGYNIVIKTYKSLDKAFLKIKKNKNKLLILPYPDKVKRDHWWINKNFKDLFIISVIPFLKKKNSTPKLVVVSKDKPILEGNNSFLYLSQISIKDKSLKKIHQLKGNYLYASANLLNYNELKFLGAYPDFKLKKNNEKN